MARLAGRELAIVVAAIVIALVVTLEVAFIASGVR